MARLVLVRYSYAPYGTYGCLFGAGDRLWTVEQPWRLNMRQRSCVPEGTYKIIPHNSAKYPNTFALINHQLNVYYQPGPGVPEDARKAILIHPANVPEDLAGCIAPGTALGFMRDRLAVVNSKVAMQAVRRVLAPNQSHDLVIASVDPSMSVDDIPAYAQELSRQ